MLTPPTVDELAVFTGRTVTELGPYADEALAQSTLMFSIVTGLTDYPDDPDLEQLAKNAIMQMADHILLTQPYAEIKAGPFQSESIGSYSYSKANQLLAKTQGGQNTGLYWWDLAVDILTVPANVDTGSGSIKCAVEGLVYTPHGAYVPDPGNLVSRPPYVRIS